MNARKMFRLHGNPRSNIRILCGVDGSYPPGTSAKYKNFLTVWLWHKALVKAENRDFRKAPDIEPFVLGWGIGAIGPIRIPNLAV
jgi:hypothetical protein